MARGRKFTIGNDKEADVIRRLCGLTETDFEALAAHVTSLPKPEKARVMGAVRQHRVRERQKHSVGKKPVPVPVLEKYGVTEYRLEKLLEVTRLFLHDPESIKQAVERTRQINELCRDKGITFVDLHRHLTTEDIERNRIAELCKDKDIPISELWRLLMTGDQLACSKCETPLIKGKILPGAYVGKILCGQCRTKR